MKTKIKVLILMLLLPSCNNNHEKVSELYTQYEMQIFAGNNEKAEKIIDKILNIDSSERYIRLKIPLLLNRCEKKEAMIFIDQILEKDKENIEFLVLKALLVDEKSRVNLLKQTDSLLVEKMKNTNGHRDFLLHNIVVVRKLQNNTNEEIVQNLTPFLSENEVSSLSQMIEDFSLEEFENMVNCK